ncbi:hypothetical protein TNCV_3662621 [Trichonephila clavipes]|nr:hypothetical protein TNCV_3662621 [Trichonephila clavipes]
MTTKHDASPNRENTMTFILVPFNDNVQGMIAASRSSLQKRRDENRHFATESALICKEYCPHLLSLHLCAFPAPRQRTPSPMDRR